MMPQSGVAQPPMAPMSMDQHQYQQQAPPPTQQQQWMMPPQQPQQPQFQPQSQPAWAQQPSQQQYGAMATTNPNPSPTGNPNEVRSLWIGDLQYWMDENYLSTCFYHTGELVSAKVIRNKQTGQSEGYGFLEFRSHAAAETILQTYNGTLMPNVEQNFRMNWASLGAGERRDDSAEHTIFVGDLAADVTDYILQETFKSVYSSVRGAKVVTDRITGRSKGYGFVKFADESEQLRAMTEMNGVLCSTRPMRIGPAANKKPVGTPQKATYQNPQATQGESDPNNTTIFVGGLDPTVAEEHLRQVFSPYGELVHVKIVAGKRCGFVQFGTRASAEQALSSLNGTQLGGQSIRLSWGRSPSSKQTDQTQWGGSGGAYYGYGQGYEAYGYAPPAQDPNMYYGNYPGYANYQQPQQ
uniref:Polyadenylate-binding protein RBP45 n=1 Tax=Nicotiana plumbaginifolia TaxID=4092 RepID=RBP45_NICPL|nr:RecName: Full=Polyadenylate-binding protein RBP45; Short=Poly(A)-binding protein RBP45; AltName: Full=RNA-binding protein 45; Short=NplRBP45 [Nicotiana plumbaginifolia]CAC01237.1 RNA Binding Protein 45 [Nicotiana plumbaginifolia]